MEPDLDSSLTIQADLEKVVSKFVIHYSKYRKLLEDQIEAIHNRQIHISNSTQLTGIQLAGVNEIIKRCREIMTSLAAEHRSIHSCVSKVGKSIDKALISNINCLNNENFLDNERKQSVLNQAIVEHLLRQGKLDVAEKLINDAKLDYPIDKCFPFSEINIILSSLKKRNIKPALDWVENNRLKLDENNSSLEFRLHRLQFIDYLKEGIDKQNEILQYARDNFQHLAFRHENEVSRLMGGLLYLKTGLYGSPYQEFLDPNNWVEICDLFVREACTMLGMSLDSPLSIAFEAGCIALPALLNLRQVMIQSSMPSVWSSKEELPILIELGKKMQFHSIFACPILRQQSSENNPPMRLTCGHVISRDALNKLVTGNRLKCPYCPEESNPSEAKQIQF